MRRRLNPKKTLPWSLSLCIPALLSVAVRDGALPRFLGLGPLVSEMDPFLLSHLRSECVEPHEPARAAGRGSSKLRQFQRFSASASCI